MLLLYLAILLYSFSFSYLQLQFRRGGTCQPLDFQRKFFRRLLIHAFAIIFLIIQIVRLGFLVPTLISLVISITGFIIVSAILGLVIYLYEKLHSDKNATPPSQDKPTNNREMQNKKPKDTQ